MLERILNILRKLIPRKIFRFFQPAYHYFLAVTGNIFYRFPGRKMICIGITGTNGKSTTAEIVNSILKTAGHKTGMISTVAIEINEKREDNKTNRTTLGRWQTPKLLRKMVKSGCNYAIIEVASEGIVHYRVWGIPFDVAVFTNLSPEHLNTHKTMARYRNAKGRLFANLSLSRKKKVKINKIKTVVPKVAVFNAEDKESGYFGSFPADQSYGFGFKKGDVQIKNLAEENGLKFEILFQNKKYPIKSDLQASFNAQNIAAAWCVGISQQIDPKSIAEGVKNITAVKGRMEKVAEKDGVKFFIDYAMTPDSYEMLIAEMRKIATGKIILVFGATGDRDKAKRPQIGEIAAKKADFTIITDDEPYSEDPKKIIAEIEIGFKNAGKDNYKIIADRKKALLEAIRLAKKGDVVVVPGIGHQSYRNIGGNKKVSWNEAEIIKSLLK